MALTREEQHALIQHRKQVGQAASVAAESIRRLLTQRLPLDGESAGISIHRHIGETMKSVWSLVETMRTFEKAMGYVQNREHREILDKRIAEDKRRLAEESDDDDDF